MWAGGGGLAAHGNNVASLVVNAVYFLCFVCREKCISNQFRHGGWGEDYVYSGNHESGSVRPEEPKPE